MKHIERTVDMTLWKYFTKNHRINWDKIFSTDMRFFSPEFFVIWFNKDKPKQIELLKSKYLATKRKLRLMKTIASKIKTIKLPYQKSINFIILESYSEWIKRNLKKGCEWVISIVL